MMDDLNFPVRLDLRIDWSELDYFGHVNNVNFFKYIQAARINYLEKTDIMEIHKRTNKGPILASCKCDFRQPLYYPGEISVYTRVSFIKNSSFGIEHRIMNQQGEVAAEGHDVIVMLDFDKHEKIKVPAELKEKIEAIESRKF